LQIDHDRGQFFAGEVSGPGFIEVADFVVLAEDAEKTAGGKKYGSRALAADQRPFLSEVRSITGNRSQGSHAADAKTAGYSVNPAVLGADRAAFHEFARCSYAFCQLAAVKKLKIRWFHDALE